MSVIVPRRASTVVLTGAGFSKDAGLPITSELVSRGRERLRTRLGLEFIDLFDALANEVLQERIGEEIEPVLTRLRVLELYSEKYKTDVQGSIEHLNYLTELLPLEMGIYMLMLAALQLPSDLPLLYDEFLRHLGDDVAFASLNYDLLLETIFRRNQRAWYYPLQGETKLFHNELGAYDGSFYAPSGQDPQSPQSIPYLKLHGSFNWYYCWRCDYFNIMREAGAGLCCELPRKGRHPLRVGHLMLCNQDECIDGGGPGMGTAVLKPLIIPPTRVKEYSRAPIRRLWAFLDLLLAQAEQIFLVGTSIRDEDVLLFNSLNLLQHKNPNMKRLIIINRDEKMKTRVHMLTKIKPLWFPDLATYIGNG